MDLGYFNARLRGLKGRLMKEGDYETLLKIESPALYLERLKSTVYGPDIEIAEMMLERTGDIMSSALRINLAETFAFVWRKAPEEAKTLLKAVFSIWEANSLKAIIRGIVRGLRRDEIIDSLIPAGEFDNAAINTLLDSKDVRDLISLLETWGSPYAGPLKKGLEAYLKRGSLVEMELGLDHFSSGFFLRAPGKRSFDDAIIRDILTLRADIQNIMTIFKIAGEGYTDEDARTFFIEGGARITRDIFLSFLVFKDRDELIRRLTVEIKDRGLKGVLSTADPEDMGMLEERLSGLIERRALGLSVVEPLSIAIAVSFIYMKAREIKNLRLIAMGKRLGIPPEEVRGFLIYPRG